LWDARGRVILPIRIKNKSKLPETEYDTVTVLGLEIPKTKDLPFGGQVQLVDLQNAFEAGEIREFEFLMRLFCLFTWRLPKTEHVRYEWLAGQKLEPEEVTEITTATTELLNHLNQPDPEAEAEDGGSKNARKAKQKN
jgi:hypothetical protein